MMVRSFWRQLWRNQRGEFITRKGLLVDSPERPHDAIYFRDQTDGTIQLWGDLSYEIEDVLLSIYIDFEEAVFEERDVFDALQMVSPTWVFQAGHESKSVFSNDKFGEFIRKNNGGPELNKMLYLVDCQALISSLQSALGEVTSLKERFFLDMALIQPGRSPKKSARVWTHGGKNATNLFLLLGALYIRMNSAIELVFKLACEAINLRTDFDSYPRFAFHSEPFKNKAPRGWNEVEETVFESSSFLRELINVRNYYIHNGYFDVNPKIYIVEEGGRIIEKFILFPDIVDGNLQKYKNRTCFYSQENKINLELTELVVEFQKRMKKTLEVLRGIITRAH